MPSNSTSRPLDVRRWPPLAIGAILSGRPWPRTARSGRPVSYDGTHVHHAGWRLVRTRDGLVAIEFVTVGTKTVPRHPRQGGRTNGDQHGAREEQRALPDPGHRAGGRDPER